VNRIDIYRQAAAAAKAALPKSDFRTSKLIDGVVGRQEPENLRRGLQGQSGVAGLHVSSSRSLT